MADRSVQLALAAATRKAIQKGQLLKPDNCARCGRGCRVVACHVRSDIIKPEWLCRSCYDGVCPREDRPRAGDLPPPPASVDAAQLGARDTCMLERAVLVGMKRQKTKDGYLVSVRQYLKHTGSKPENWHGESVERWRDHLLRAGMKPRSVNVRLGGLKYASRRLQALGWGPDFAKGAEQLPAPLEKRRKPVGMDSASRLVSACIDGTPRGLRDTAMLMLGFRCGVRREGIVNLDFGDVGPGRKLTIIQKGGARHEIPAADDEVLGALRDWMGWLRGHGVKEGPVFRAVNTRGVSKRRLCPGSVNLIVKERAAQAGLTSENIHPHLMRHSFVSWQVAAGVPDRRIMAVTGHRNPTILSTYTTDILADLDPVGDKIPSLKRRRL